MSMHQGKNGGWYGTLPVILTRVVEPTECGGERVTESFIGSKSPYGGISVHDKYNGVRFREAPVGWWRDEGFTITIDAAMAQLHGWTEEQS